MHAQLMLKNVSAAVPVLPYVPQKQLLKNKLFISQNGKTGYAQHEPVFFQETSYA
jgi:hypothetical protein